MKKILALFLVFFTGFTFAENTIIALVNNVPISLNSLNDEFISAKKIENKIEKVLEDVGLSADDKSKYIHEFSGGQRQRIAIARALIIKPKLVIFDEAVSALDVTVRAQILDLIAELAAEYGLTYLFISHDLSVIRSITDRCLVMKNGKIIEQGLTKKVLEQPQNTYTKKLIDAVPKLPNFQMEL